MALSDLPSVDQLLSSDSSARLVALYGRAPVTRALRAELDVARQNIRAGGSVPSTEAILSTTGDRLARESESSLQTVMNLTGTVLHTNLGRAPLPPEAIEAMARIAAQPSNLEYDLDSGRRGDRDTHIENLIVQITGAEAATVVNNNAAAVLLALNTLALGKEVVVSRGELIEIGGSFRIPDIMARAGCRLVEVGTTNRTHPADYERAIGKDTALIMKVHTSNYEIRGFTRSVSESELAALCQSRTIPLVTDLGSGTLVDLQRYGLPEEPTVQSALANGADLVTFSGDKLLGGPQAGIIAGKRELVAKMKANPLKRALRVDKLTLAALFEVLKLYRDPESLPRRLPALQLLSRPIESIKEAAGTVHPVLAKRLAGVANVTIEAAMSQVGSGSLPLDQLPSLALVIAPLDPSEAALQGLASAFRHLPTPVIGRVHDGKLLFDVRTLERPQEFNAQLSQLDVP